MNLITEAGINSYKIHKSLMNALSRIIEGCKAEGTNEHTTTTLPNGVKFSGDDGDYIYTVSIIKKGAHNDKT